MSAPSVVLVTGSSRGIGMATVEVLAGRGHLVYASMRDPRGRNRSAADRLSQLGRTIRIVDLDVRSTPSVDRAVETVIAQDGRLDVVVNNAGVMNLGLVEGFTVEQLHGQLDVNFYGPARLFRAALPHMRECGGGLFVTVSSLAGRVVFPFLGTYNPSKWAVEALAEAYRYELAPFGIDSIIVQPGPFLTGIIDAAPLPADIERLQAYGPLADAPARAMEAFREMMRGSPEHDPTIVAEDIARLVELPPGDRPLRTVSGVSHGVERINEVALDVQRALMDAMGVNPL